MLIFFLLVCHGTLEPLYFILFYFIIYFSWFDFSFFISWMMKRYMTVVTWHITSHDVIGLESRRRARRMMSRCISIACSPHNITNFIQLVSLQPVDWFLQTKLCWKAPNKGYQHICRMYKSNNKWLRYQVISNYKIFVC